MEKKIYQKLKSNKKKKKRTVFYYLPIVKQYVDKKEAEEKRPAWSPAPRKESTTYKLENGWIIDLYGYQRKPKGSDAFYEDEPYIPKIIDTLEPDPQKDQDSEE